MKHWYAKIGYLPLKLVGHLRKLVGIVGEGSGQHFFQRRRFAKKSIDNLFDKGFIAAGEVFE
jgi:hypothetical protein